MGDGGENGGPTVSTGRVRSTCVTLGMVGRTFCAGAGLDPVAGSGPGRSHDGRLHVRSSAGSKPERCGPGHAQPAARGFPRGIMSNPRRNTCEALLGTSESTLCVRRRFLINRWIPQPTGLHLRCRPPASVVQQRSVHIQRHAARWSLNRSVENQ